MMLIRRLLWSLAIIVVFALWAWGFYHQFGNPPMMVFYLMVSALIVAVARG